MVHVPLLLQTLVLIHNRTEGITCDTGSPPVPPVVSRKIIGNQKITGIWTVDRQSHIIVGLRLVRNVHRVGNAQTLRKLMRISGTHPENVIHVLNSRRRVEVENIAVIAIDAQIASIRERPTIGQVQGVLPNR